MFSTFGTFSKDLSTPSGYDFSFLKICEYSVQFPIPFYRHLCYNYLVIRDIPLCISNFGIHLHPLQLVFENFPVTWKMYFYALFYFFEQWITCQIYLHYNIRYLRQKIMIFHRITIPAVQMLNIIYTIFLIVESFIFNLPASSCHLYHFFQIFCC